MILEVRISVKITAEGDIAMLGVDVLNIGLNVGDSTSAIVLSTEVKTKLEVRKEDSTTMNEELATVELISLWVGETVSVVGKEVSKLEDKPEVALRVEVTSNTSVEEIKSTLLDGTTNVRVSVFCSSSEEDGGGGVAETRVEVTVSEMVMLKVLVGSKAMVEVGVTKLVRITVLVGTTGVMLCSCSDEDEDTKANTEVAISELVMALDNAVMKLVAIPMLSPTDVISELVLLDSIAREMVSETCEEGKVTGGTLVENIESLLMSEIELCVGLTELIDRTATGDDDKATFVVCGCEKEVVVRLIAALEGICSEVDVSAIVVIVGDICTMTELTCSVTSTSELDTASKLDENVANCTELEGSSDWELASTASEVIAELILLLLSRTIDERAMAMIDVVGTTGSVSGVIKEAEDAAAVGDGVGSILLV